MRPNHQRRQRGRNGKPNKFPNRNQSYDSNGPDVRVRGTAHQIYEKYQALAREAATSGDRVMAEAYYQHAEHYFRIIQAQGGFVQPRYPQPWEESEASDEAASGGPDGSASDAGAGGLDPSEVPQPAVEYPPRVGFTPAEDYQARDGGYSNGEERHRGRDEARGGERSGYEGRRQERRDDEGTYGSRGGRRDFVTRAEQRHQERYERQQASEAPVAAPEATATPPVAPDEARPDGGQAAAADPQAQGGAAGENRRSFRPRHPHFRRFRGGPRSQGGVDPAQQDQPDLTSGGSGGSGNGTS